MKKIVLSLILASGFVFAAAEANTTKTEAAAPAAGNAEKGKALYAKCAGCHGANAEKKALAKSEVIAGWDAAKTVEALKGYKAGTRNAHGMGGVMKGNAQMSDAEMADVAAFIASLKK